MQDNHEASHLAIPALFTHAGRCWRRHLKQLWWIVLGILVPVTLLNMIGGHLDQEFFADLSWLSLLLRYGSKLLLVVAWMAVLLISAAWMEGKDFSLREAFNTAGDRYIPGGLAFLAAYLARVAGLALIGLLAFSLPGDSSLRSLLLLLGVPLLAVALMMWVSIAPFLTVIGGRPIGAALRVSAHIASLHWRAVSGLLLLLTVLQGIVSLLVWYVSSVVDAGVAQFALSSGFSFYGSTALRIAILLPVRMVPDITLLYALTVFTVFFVNRRTEWGLLGDESPKADEGMMGDAE
mgnify:FL=1